MIRSPIHTHLHGECGCGCGGHSSTEAEPESARSWDAVPDDEVICHCASITKSALVEAIRNGAYTVPLLKVLTGIGRAKPCPNDHQCVSDTIEIIRRYGTTTLSDALVSVAEQPREES